MTSISSSEQSKPLTSGEQNALRGSRVLDIVFNAQETGGINLEQAHTIGNEALEIVKTDRKAALAMLSLVQILNNIEL